MKTTQVIVTNPIMPFSSREVSEIEVGKTIFNHLFASGHIILDEVGNIKRVGYFIVCVNGKATMQKDWNSVIGEDDVLFISTIPMGGGGGGSNIGTIIMTVIMVAAAAFTGGASLGVALMWGAAAGVAVGLLSTMVPSPEAATSSNGRESASSTYTISSQNNSAKLLEAIPVQYGRMRRYPDLAAQPYTENRGNFAQLYQLLCIGQGEFDIEKIQIEDSDISGFGEVQYEVIQPGGVVTLFPDNVVTSDAVQGLEMLGPNQAGYDTLGPFVTSPSGSKVNFIAVDLTMPLGAYSLGSQGEIYPSFAIVTFERRLIDDTGAPLGTWETLGSHQLQYATQTLQMITFKYDVPEGRYEIRASRQNNAPTDAKSGNKVVWSSLRGYIPSNKTYGNVTLLAVIIQATNNLNSSTARRVNVICTRKVKTWDPINGWTPTVVANRNPAWAFADALRNSDYGGRWADNKINLTELYRLSQVWNSRGDTFNGVFDKTITLWSALTQIVAVGRATPVYYAGMIDVVRDEPKTIPAQIFTPANIIENSFKVSYKLGTSETPDHIIVEYFDETVWQATTVVCALPGSAMLNPINVQMFGVTNVAQARREGLYKSAVNRDQRNRTAFSTEMEGLLLRYGDLVKASHDVPAWGQSGKLLTLNVATGKITTTEPLVFGSGNYIIAFRNSKGKSIGPFQMAPDPNPVEGVNSGIITSGDKTTIPVSDGVRTDYTHYAFGRTEREAQQLIVISAKPDNKGNTSMVFAPYSASVHIADQGGDVPLPPPVSELPNIEVGPIINSVSVNETTVSGQQQITATPASGAVYYVFEARRGTSGEWQELGISQNAFLFVNLANGAWQVRVKAMGAIFGPYANTAITLTGNVLAVPKIATFVPSTTSLFAIDLYFQLEPGSQIAHHVEIWYNLTSILGSATKLADVPYPATSYTLTNLGPGDTFYFWARVVDTAGRAGDWYNNAVGLMGRASSNADDILELLESKITSSQLAQSLLEQIDGGGEAMVAVEALTNELAAMYTIKTQLTVDGRTYIGGIGVGVENNDGIVESQVLVAADKFAVLDPDVDGSATVPFVIVGGVVYMNAAFIQDGTITNAKIGDVLQSVDYIEDVSGWIIKKDGTVQINGPAGGGRVSISENGIQVFDENNVRRVLIGAYNP